MQAQTNERPPHVQFEYRALPDRTQSEAQGHAAYRNVAFAMITPAGSKDCVEKEAEVWLREIAERAQKGFYPPEWVPKFDAAYAMWLKGEEVPPDGTPLKMWPQMTPAELMQCKGAGVLTVEDLAVANEQLIQRIGMNGRVLKQKAEAWLQASAGGKLAEQIANLQEEVRRKDDIIEQLGTKLDRVMAQLEATQGDAPEEVPVRRGPGRPRKDESLP